MRNRYPGRCYICGDYVAAGCGHFQRNRKTSRGGKWIIKCVPCVMGKQVDGTDPEVRRKRALARRHY